MPTPQTTGKAAPRNSAQGTTALPTGADVYDTLMRKIEPELVRANLDKLDAPYKNETEAEHRARYRRYAKAFAVYKKTFSTWAMNLKKAVQTYKRAVFKASERVSKREEESAMQSLEEQMQNV